MIDLTVAPVMAADKPNILFIALDDNGYGDLGPYGGGEGRGMQCDLHNSLPLQEGRFCPFRVL